MNDPNGNEVGMITVSNNGGNSITFNFETYAYPDGYTYGWKMINATVEIGSVIARTSWSYGTKSYQATLTVSASSAFSGYSLCNTVVEFEAFASIVPDGRCNGSCSAILNAVAIPNDDDNGSNSPHHLVCCLCTSRTQNVTDWSKNCSSHNTGCYRDSHWVAAYPAGFMLGGVACTGSKNLTFTSSSALKTFMGQPSSLTGAAHPLTSSSVNPTSSTAGKLAGSLAALALSVRMDRLDPNWQDSCNKLSDLYICAPHAGDCNFFDGLTIAEVIQEGHNVLAGCEVPTYSAENLALCLLWIENALEGGQQSTVFGPKGLSSNHCHIS